MWYFRTTANHILNHFACHHHTEPSPLPPHHHAGTPQCMRHRPHSTGNPGNIHNETLLQDPHRCGCRGQWNTRLSPHRSGRLPPACNHDDRSRCGSPHCWCSCEHTHHWLLHIHQYLKHEAMNSNIKLQTPYTGGMCCFCSAKLFLRKSIKLVATPYQHMRLGFPR